MFSLLLLIVIHTGIKRTAKIKTSQGLRE